MKKVAILFSGQIRSNQLNDQVKNDSLVNDSVQKYFLNEEFKQKYDYDIFISTDTINLQGAKDFFGQNLKNIHLYEKDFYLKPIHFPIAPFEKFQEIYKTYNFEGKYVSPGNLMQMYRILDVCSLMEAENIGYDVIVRCRLDTVFKQNLVPLFDELTRSSVLEVIALTDQFILGKPCAMIHYLHTFAELYMKYRRTKQDFDYFIMDSKKYYQEGNEHWWLFSPELQQSECFFEYCNQNNLVVKEVLKGYNHEDWLYIYNRQLFCL